MEGEDVLKVQMRLGMQGYTIAADAKYGKITASVIRQFQHNNKLKEDGIVNESTYELLFGGSR